MDGQQRRCGVAGAARAAYAPDAGDRREAVAEGDGGVAREPGAAGETGEVTAGGVEREHAVEGVEQRGEEGDVVDVGGLVPYPLLPASGTPGRDQAQPPW